MEELITKLQEFGTLYGIKIVGALFIFIIGRLVAKGLRTFVRKIMLKSKVDDTLISFTTSLGYAVVMVFVVIAAINKLGIQTTSFIAILGAAGLAIGLAMQGSLSNFAAGVLLIIFKPFKIISPHFYKSIVFVNINSFYASI